MRWWNWRARLGARGEVSWSDGSEGPHEAGWLALDSAKARQVLGVQSRWGLTESVARTMAWYRQHQAGADARALVPGRVGGLRGGQRMSRFIVSRSHRWPASSACSGKCCGTNGASSARLFCADELACRRLVRPGGPDQPYLYTRRRGTVRGLHYQKPPHAEIKLVSCLRGEVWDVAVDLRVGSPTFLRWHAETLSADNGTCPADPAGLCPRLPGPER